MSPIAPNILRAYQEFYRREPAELAKQRRPLIVGFGHKARNGKNTAVEHIIQIFNTEHLSVRHYSFAEALKREVFDFLQTISRLMGEGGFDISFKHKFKGHFQEVPLPISNETEVFQFIETYKSELRHFLQWWGTELRRAQDENYWVRKTYERILSDGANAAVISDMRFRNEALMCDVTVRVEREGYVDAAAGTHASETELDDWPYDYVLTAKDGDVEGLQASAAALFDKILAERRILGR